MHKEKTQPLNLRQLIGQFIQDQPPTWKNAFLRKLAGEHYIHPHYRKSLITNTTEYLRPNSELSDTVQQTIMAFIALNNELVRKLEKVDIHVTLGSPEVFDGNHLQPNGKREEHFHFLRHAARQVKEDIHNGNIQKPNYLNTLAYSFYWPTLSVINSNISDTQKIDFSIDHDAINQDLVASW